MDSCDFLDGKTKNQCGVGSRVDDGAANPKSFHSFLWFCAWPCRRYVASPTICDDPANLPNVRSQVSESYLLLV